MTIIYLILLTSRPQAVGVPAVRPAPAGEVLTRQDPGFGILQILVFLVLLALLTKPLGTYMARVFKGERTFLHPVLRPVERAHLPLCGIDEEREMRRWTRYTVSLLASTSSSFLVHRTRSCGCRASCRSIPAHRARAMDGLDLAFNTAVSFATNTNWQAYVRRERR